MSEINNETQEAAGTDLVGIGMAAKLSGVSERAIRYWENLGLISTTRLPSGHRKYSAADIMKIKKLRGVLKTERIRIKDLITSAKMLQDPKVREAVGDTYSDLIGGND